MTFVKVVEGSEIYNFPIHHILHFYSKIWRKTNFNRAGLNFRRATARQAAPPPRATA
jgi:hypothetical protein